MKVPLDFNKIRELDLVNQVKIVLEILQEMKVEMNTLTYPKNGILREFLEDQK